MIPLVSVLLSAVGHIGFKLVESAFKSKTDEAPAADFGKELQCRLDQAAATPPDGLVRYAQTAAGPGIRVSDVAGTSLAPTSVADAVTAYSKLVSQWPGRFPSGRVIDSLQAP